MKDTPKPNDDPAPKPPEGNETENPPQEEENGEDAKPKGSDDPPDKEEKRNRVKKGNGTAEKPTGASGSKKEEEREEDSKEGDGQSSGTGFAPEVPDGDPDFEDIKNQFEKRRAKEEDRGGGAKTHVLPQQTGERIAKTFVPPNKLFADLLTDRKSLRGQSKHERVLVLHGGESAWNWACAVALAQELCKFDQDSLGRGTEIRYHVPTAERGRWSLLELAAQGEFGRRPSVCIVKNAFESGIDPEELSSQIGDAVSAELGEKKLFVILTTNESREVSADVSAPNYSTEPQGLDFKLVLRRNLEYYGCDEALVDAAQTAAADLRSLFGGADLDRLDALGKQLRAESATGDPEQDKSLVIEAASSLKRFRKRRLQPGWFAGLDENVQLYAMLSLLFEGIEGRLLDELYIRSTNLLRKSGIENLRDPREDGFDDILAQLGAQPWSAGVVEFDDDALRGQLDEQIRNYRYLLWTLLNSLLELVDEYSAPQYWAFRQKLGGAIGRIATCFSDYEVRLGDILRNLTSHSSGGVVAVCGYALERTCAVAQGWEYATGLLREWIRSGDSQHMWAAGLSIWRIYVALPTDGAEAEAQRGDLEELLEDLAHRVGEFSRSTRLKAFLESKAEAQEDGELSPEAREISAIAGMVARLAGLAARNFEAVVDALVHMEYEQPGRVAALMRRWLRDGDFGLDAAAHLACSMVFQRHLSYGSAPGVVGDDELVALIEVALSTDPQVVAVMLRAFGEWMRRPAWQSRVHKSLLRAVNRSNDAARNLLVKAIHEVWLGASDCRDEIVPVARAVAARAVLLNGRPVLPDSDGRGVVVVDCGERTRFERMLPNVAAHLIERLSVQGAVTVYRMGDLNQLASGEVRVSADEIVGKSSRPALCLPALESDGFCKPAYALVLLGDRTRSDIDDADSLGWEGRWVIGELDSGESDDPAETDGRHEVLSEKGEISVIGISLDEGETFPWRAADAMAAEVDVRIAKAMATFSGATPEVGQLADEAKRMDEEGSSKHPGDLMQHLADGVALLSAGDLGSGVGVVRAWLEDNDLPKRVLGVAAARWLFGQRGDTSFGLETGRILADLFRPLAAHGGDGVTAVASLLYDWAGEPEFATALLSTASERDPLTDFVSGLAEDGAAVLVGELAAWRDREDSENLERNDGKESGDRDRIAHQDPREFERRRVRERLSMLVHQALRKPLPALSDGKSYAVIVIDRSTPVSVDRTRLDHIFDAMLAEGGPNLPADLQLVGFVLGSDQEVLLSPGAERASALLASAEWPLSPLLNPTLDRFEVGSVWRVIVLSNRFIVDWQDSFDLGWSNLIFLYTEREEEMKRQSEHYSRMLRKVKAEKDPDQSAASIAREFSAGFPT